MDGATFGGGLEDGLVGVLRRRPTQARAIQALYIAGAVALGLALPAIRRGPLVPSGRLTTLLFAVSGAYISYIALVFSILFIVAQYANTSLTPRLNLFRDDPLIAHSLGLLVGVFVFTTTAGLAVNVNEETSIAVPLATVVVVLVSLLLTRALQLHAYRVLQLSSALDQVTERGSAVLEAFYRRPARTGATTEPPPDLASARLTVTWPSKPGVLRQLDLPSLVRAASAAGAVIVLRVRVGGELQRGHPVLSVHGGEGPVSEQRLLAALDAGQERTFAQDPQFALRLLSDISIRALSSAVNDPTTAVQGLACINHLLGLVVDRDLDLGRITDDDGTLRVVLELPTWEDLLATGLNDIVHYGAHAPTVVARLGRLIDDLADRAPPERRAALVALRPTS